MGSSIGQSKCGVANVTWGLFEEMMTPAKVINKKSEFKLKNLQRGRLETIVLHCMNAIKIVSKPSTCYDIDKNIEILKNYRFSAHFIINREGEIFHLVDINRYASHASDANSQSVGIELLGFADYFRTETEEKYKKYKEEYEKLLSERDILNQKLTEYQSAKEDGKNKVQLDGKTVLVEKAIKNTDDAIKIRDKEIEVKKAWIDDYEKFIEKKDDKGVPFIFHYTEQQYEALNQLLTVTGRRYGYKFVRSHYSISPDRKKDPGVYFNWDKITPYLLKGKLAGDEKGTGGIYKVEN